MKYLFHTSLSNVSYVNTFKNLGFLVGTLCKYLSESTIPNHLFDFAVGFLFCIINRQLTIAVMICVLGVFTAIMPFCTSIWQLYLSSFISLVGGGAFDVGVVPWIIEIWGQHSAPLLQLLKASQGLGVIFGPLLDEPFLMGELQVMNITRYHKNETLIEMATEELNYSIDRRTNLQIPFLVTGCVAIPGK